jgi:hypothetical protein
MRNAEANSDTVVLKRIEAISGHRKELSKAFSFWGFRFDGA